MTASTTVRGCPEFLSSRPNRRELIRVGALTLGGLGLAQLIEGRTSAAMTHSVPAGFGNAKACILIFMWGGPSQLDTWDPKPDAPDFIRGDFKAISTNVPGIQISEHFPRLSQQLHRLAIIRSMTHDDPAHLSTVHWLQTGHLAPRPKSDTVSPSPNDWPHLGSIIAKVRPATGAIPPAVIMPWIVSHPAAPGGVAPGQHGGWLGKSFDPFRVEGDPNSSDFHVDGLELPAGVDLDRLARRRILLQRGFESANHVDPWNQHQSKAIDALSSAEARGAFRVDDEDPRLRDRYGRHIHGQCLLLARRLVEAGVRLVTVNWHNDGRNFWDTHGDNFNNLKDRLMPPADQGFSALLDDLSSRGLLDETLVVWVGEFGRTPKVVRSNSGREHWPRCYSAVVAGAGIPGGRIHGASDRWAAYPARDPVSPEDLAATMLHALGIDPAGEILDPTNRPHRINDGSPLVGLFN